jgi:hypothetical protein
MGCFSSTEIVKEKSQYELEASSKRKPRVYSFARPSIFKSVFIGDIKSGDTTACGIYMYIYVCIYMYVCIHVRVYTCIYICI